MPIHRLDGWIGLSSKAINYASTFQGAIVPGTNVKQVEAAERSSLIKVSSYSIDLDLTTGAENFRVKTTVTFAGLKPGATT